MTDHQSTNLNISQPFITETRPDHQSTTYPRHQAPSLSTIYHRHQTPSLSTIYHRHQAISLSTSYHRHQATSLVHHLSQTPGHITIHHLSQTPGPTTSPTSITDTRPHHQSTIYHRHQAPSLVHHLTQTPDPIISPTLVTEPTIPHKAIPFSLDQLQTLLIPTILISSLSTLCPPCKQTLTPMQSEHSF